MLFLLSWKHSLWDYPVGRFSNFQCSNSRFPVQWSNSLQAWLVKKVFRLEIMFITAAKIGVNSQNRAARNYWKLELLPNGLLENRNYWKLMYWKLACWKSELLDTRTIGNWLLENRNYWKLGVLETGNWKTGDRIRSFTLRHKNLNSQ